jgi:CheY-like chemotaxis protein
MVLAFQHARRPADILVVEDDTDCREILHDVLEHAGHTVVTAVDRREALQMIEGGRRPTIIIMDLMMPDLDMPGFQARLSDLGAADIPVVAISAANEREVPTPQGTRDRFIKPIDLERLLNTVQVLTTH